LCFNFYLRKSIKKANNSGGILGGISTVGDICFRVAFKPVPSIGKLRQTVDFQGNPCIIQINGRHDGCLVPRALPIVESMAALVLMDMLLEHRQFRLTSSNI
jgi:chorismate synthase